MIALARCVFPKGTTGANIDVVARQPLWNNKMNYGHGTGHGVGHFLCVHEGPQDIRQAWRAQAILPGMVTSDEPGMYRENSHGIRHENLIVCQELGENEFGEWCGFETITLCYFDTSALLRGLDKRLSDKLNIPFHIAEDPLRAVARGTGIALKNVDKFSFLIR